MEPSWATVSVPRELVIAAAVFAATSLLLSPEEQLLVVVITTITIYVQIMDVKAFEALKVFQAANEGAIDTKVRYLNDIKSDIKHKSVPEVAIATIFEVIHRGIASSQSQQLMLLSFSTLSNFLKRLHGQGQINVIGFHGHKLYYSLLVEKLSDQRDNIRTAASKAFSDFWLYVHPESRFEIEHNVIQNVLSGKNPRPKVTSLQWVTDMVKDHGLKFRPYVSLLINCLEDADGAVRDTAKTSVIQLFKSTSTTAVAELKEQLRLRNVRKTIADAILAEVEISSRPQQELSSSVLSRSPATSFQASLPARPHTRAELQRPTSVMSNRHGSRSEATKMTPAHSSNTPHRPDLTSPRTTTQTKHIQLTKRLNRSVHHAHTQSNTSEPGPEVDTLASDPVHTDVAPPVIKTNDAGIVPLYVDSGKQLSELIMSTRIHFEDRETEGNWNKREESIKLMRRITKGNAPVDYRLTYLGDMHSMVGGILKGVNSLRTTLSTTACELVQEMCKAAGNGIDSMMEILLQDLIKLCAGTKKISANNGNITVDAIIASASFNKSIINHISQASEDKNVSPRTFAAGWLKTLMRAHRQGCNRSGCLELIEKSIKKGLGDAQPGVRSNMRSTYWTFAEFWPEKAHSIMSSLDAKSQNLLQQDPSNPNLPSAVAKDLTSSRPESRASRAKQSLKEAIANQKKLKMQMKPDDLPSRPASAMSVMTESKATGKAAVRPAPVSTPTAPNPVTTTHSIAQSGSLLSAPMRPPMRPATSRRPEASRHNVVDAQALGSAPDTETVTAKTPHLPPQTERHTAKSSMTSADESIVKSAKMKTSVASRETQNPHVTTAKKPPTSPPKPKKTTLPTPVGSPARPKVQPQKSISFAPTAVIDDGVSRSEESEQDPPPPRRNSTLPQPVLESTLVKKRSDEEFSLASSGRNRSLSGASLTTREGASVGHRTSISGIPRPVKSHSRQSSDELSYAAEPIKVYEDPFVSGETVDISSADRTINKTALTPPANVLEDLPVNPRTDLSRSPAFVLPEGFIPESPLRGDGHPNESEKLQAQRRWQKVETALPGPIQPRSNERSVNQDQLRRYIEGIRNKSIDIMGFRKLQGIIHNHDKIFDDEVLFDDMVLALLDLLESSNDLPRQFLGRVHDQKESTIATIKLIFDKQPKYVEAYHARALSALIAGRQYFDNSSHIVSGFDALTNKILLDCSPNRTMDAVLDILNLQENNEITDRSMIMGMTILNKLLEKCDPVTVNQDYEPRLVEVARNGFARPRPAIRRAMVGYARKLATFITPESRFLSLVAGGDLDLRSLLTYYVHVQG